MGFHISDELLHGRIDNIIVNLRDDLSYWSSSASQQLLEDG